MHAQFEAMFPAVFTLPGRLTPSSLSPDYVQSLLRGALVCMLRPSRTGPELLRLVSSKVAVHSAAEVEAYDRVASTVTRKRPVVQSNRRTPAALWLRMKA